MSDKTQKWGYDNVPFENMKTYLPQSIKLLTPRALYIAIQFEPMLSESD